MIGTVTLNPCIDRTIELPSLEVGDMNRMASSRRDVSGKGINVSLALTRLGLCVRSCGFIYGGNRDYFLSSLERSGVAMDGVSVEGMLRENLKIWDRSSGLTTEINQSGEYVPDEKWKSFLKYFRSFVSGLGLAVISGSVPKGIKSTAYRELMEIAGEENVPVILDAEGDLLLEGMKAHPLMIKPNLYEFRKTFSLEDDSDEAIAEKAAEIRTQYGIKYVFVSLGSRGALLSSDEGDYFSPSIDIPVKSTQGAGDAFVSGAAKAYEEGKSAADMLSYGMAAAASAVMKEGTEMCDLESFSALLPAVSIKEIRK